MRSSTDVAQSAGGSQFYIDRARESLWLADIEKLPARAMVHMRAAERWIQLAERARRVEARAEARLRIEDGPRPA